MLIFYCIVNQKIQKTDAIRHLGLIKQNEVLKRTDLILA
jgi:hypothetical protein